MIINDEVYLEHYGVVGMKWGERRANRALNKASSAKDWDKHAKDVDAARAKVKSGKLKAESKKAKAQYNQDKLVMGSREARKILNKKRMKINETYATSQQVKTKKGQYALAAALIGFGALQVASTVAGSKY